MTSYAKIGTSNETMKPPILDAIELTMILKSIGFRLDSFDFQAKATHTAANGGARIENDCIPMAKSLSPQSKSDDDVISVQIACGKSNIVSRMTYRLRDSADCSCPDMASVNNNNSFWEIQATGPFSNRRCSGLFTKNDDQIENDTSSNLLPVMSPKSIALTNGLIQVLLKQYKEDMMPGKAATQTTQRGLNDFKEVISSAATETMTEDTAADTHSSAPFNDDASSDSTSATQSEPQSSPQSVCSGRSPQNGYQTIGSNQIAAVIQNLNQMRYLLDVSVLQMKLNSCDASNQNNQAQLTVTPCFANKTTGRFFQSSSASKVLSSASLLSSKKTYSAKISLSPNRKSITPLTRIKPDLSKIKSRIGSVLSSATTSKVPKDELTRTGSLKDGVKRTTTSTYLARSGSTRATTGATSKLAISARVRAGLGGQSKHSNLSGENDAAAPVSKSRKSLPAIATTATVNTKPKSKELPPFP